jgi:hypothetical protein
VRMAAGMCLSWLLMIGDAQASAPTVTAPKASCGSVPRIVYGGGYSSRAIGARSTTTDRPRQ